MYLALYGGVVQNSSHHCVHTLLPFQPSIKSFGTERLIRTSLDLELDLQASKTWHDRLVQEISVLRELKEQLEQAQSQGEKELPQWVKDDERFRLLLRLVEKRVSSICLWILFKMFEKCELRNRVLWTVRKQSPSSHSSLPLTAPSSKQLIMEVAVLECLAILRWGIYKLQSLRLPSHRYKG